MGDGYCGGFVANPSLEYIYMVPTIFRSPSYNSSNTNPVVLDQVTSDSRSYAAQSLISDKTY